MCCAVSVWIKAVGLHGGVPHPVLPLACILLLASCVILNQACLVSPDPVNTPARQQHACVCVSVTHSPTKETQTHNFDLWIMAACSHLKTFSVITYTRAWFYFSFSFVPSFLFSLLQFSNSTVHTNNSIFTKFATVMASSRMDVFHFFPHKN